MRSAQRIMRFVICRPLVLANSLSMILVCEMGDKTFFIAAIMAMRHDRLVIFAGAISALAVMTVCAFSWESRMYFCTARPTTPHCALGTVFHDWICSAERSSQSLHPLRWGCIVHLFRVRMQSTNHVWAVPSALYCAITNIDSSYWKMHTKWLTRARRRSCKRLRKSSMRRSQMTMSRMVKQKQPNIASSTRFLFKCVRVRSLLKLPMNGPVKLSLNGPVTRLTQAFTLTFLAEWGDRSQIATIALAASKDPVSARIYSTNTHCSPLFYLGGPPRVFMFLCSTASLLVGSLVTVFAQVSLVMYLVHFCI